MSEFVTPDAVITFPAEHGPATLPFGEIFPCVFSFDPHADASGEGKP
jgi:hypothetical protein